MMQCQILHGDCREVLRELPAESVHCVVTSPPYWGLRSYGGDKDMIGLEPTFDEHLKNLVAVFREVWRVLRSDGTIWLNYGDAYARGDNRGGSGSGDKQASNAGSAGVVPRAVPGLKPKDLMMMPADVARALRSDGWWLRSKIVWAKPNPMPESVTDRPTSAYEELFLLTKSPRYFYDAEAVRVHDGNGWHGKDRPTHAPEHAESQGQGPRNLRGQYAKPYEGQDGKDFAKTGAQDARSTKARIVEGVRNGTITGANLRNVWTIPTHSFKGAHFATFPPKLVEPCIKAGTSERGVCGECGAPWKRQVETKNGRGRSWHDHVDDQSRGQRGDSCPDGYERTTIGWAPTCEHYDDLYREMSRQPRRARKRQQRAAWSGRWRRVRARPGSDKWETVPATVCDPFAGSGTAGEVALLLGRSFVGVEINAEYVAMGSRRTDTVAPLFRDAPEGKQP